MSESFLPLLFFAHHTYCDAEANQLASEKSRNDCVRFLFGANKTFSSASGFKKDGHARARHQHKPENAGNSGLEVGNTLKCSILSPPRPEGARRRDSSNLLLRNMHIRVEKLLYECAARTCKQSVLLLLETVERALWPRKGKMQL